MYFSPKTTKRLLNLYPPFIGAGIRVKEISEDWLSCRVGMSVRWYNRNAVGTHFGGSIYSMTDPHLMLMLMQLLGKEYIVWDQAAEVRYLKATREPITAEIEISAVQLDEILMRTAHGNKFLPQFTIPIYAQNGELIAEVQKTLYVRRKPDQEMKVP